MHSMIGSPPFADNLSKIYLNELDNSEFVNKVENETYEKGDAYGFIVEELESDLLSAYLLLTRPEVRQVFDEDTQRVESREIQTIEKIPFRVDFKFNTLEVFADQKSVSKVSSKIGQLTNWDSTIETANFSPLSVIDSLGEEYRTELTSIKISNYPASDSVVGDFSADVDDQKVGENLIQQYRDNVTYLGIRVKTETDSVTLGIYDSGSIVVYNEMEGVIEILDSIKQSILEGEYNA